MDLIYNITKLSEKKVQKLKEKLQKDFIIKINI